MFFQLGITEEMKVKELRGLYRSMLITKREAAKELGGISTSTIDRMRKEGLINSVQVRGRVMFAIDEIARIIIEG